MALTNGSEFTNDEASYGVFQTPQVSYYVIAPSRGAQVITDVMEEAVPEVWVTPLETWTLFTPEGRKVKKFLTG